VKLTRAGRQPVPMKHHRKTLSDLSHQMACRASEGEKSSRFDTFVVAIIRSHCRKFAWISRLGNRRAVLRALKVCREWLAWDSDMESEWRANRERRARKRMEWQS
jgi:hypothetical protein